MTEKSESRMRDIDTASQEVHFIGKKDPLTFPEGANSMGC